jgi:hypothetical protein
MTETYTFSRALHLMRYGGKKMRSDRATYKATTETLFELHPVLGWVIASALYECEIMGSWIEVKDA